MTLGSILALCGFTLVHMKVSLTTPGNEVQRQTQRNLHDCGLGMWGSLPDQAARAVKIWVKFKGFCLAWDQQGIPVKRLICAEA